MSRSNPINENTYVLFKHINEFIDDIVLDQLGLEIIAEPLRLDLEKEIINTYSYEIIAKEPDENLLELRTCFYQAFKPLYEQLSPYTRYAIARDETFQLPPIYIPNLVGEIQLADASMIVLSELNSKATDRLKKIAQIDDIYERQKKDLFELATIAPTTIQLHAALKETILESQIYWRLMNPTLKKEIRQYFNQINTLINLCQKDPNDENALGVLRLELTKTYYNLQETFDLRGLEKKILR